MEQDDIQALVVAPTAKLLPIPGAPRLSRASTTLLQEIEIVDERDEVRAICVPIEKPLAIWLDGRELVTLMTLGAAPEWLVLGYLRNQRRLRNITDLESVHVDWLSGTARVQSRAGNEAPDASQLETAGTACALGTAFGDVLQNLRTLALPSADAARISRSVLLSILASMRTHDHVHRAAGSVHSCALFQSSQLMIAVEDISRHNGVDTITGWMALHAVSGADKILFTTGRLTGEMVAKAAFSGIPILITRNGVTSMGRDLAVKLGMTLLGRAANQRYVCYAGIARFDSAL
jgi:FdhD protein